MRANLQAAVLLLTLTAAPVSLGQTITTPPVTTAPSTFREPVTCQWLANVGAGQNGGQFLRARNTTSHVLPRGTRLGWTVRYVLSGQDAVQTRSGTNAVATLVPVGGEAGTSLHLTVTTPYTIQSCEIIAAYGQQRR